MRPYNVHTPHFPVDKPNPIALEIYRFHLQLASIQLENNVNTIIIIVFRGA